MKILVLGDVHAYWEHMNIVIANALRKHKDICAIVQVGDFGYAMGTKPFKLSRGFYQSDDEHQHAHSIPKYWNDGNHENHDLLDQDKGAWQQGWTYQPRGSVITINNRNIMFFGGASSIDKSTRTPGVSWWPQESITMGQTMRALEYNGKLDIVFSHEFPAAFEYDSWKDNFGMPDRLCLQQIQNKYQPPVWIFGHHHEYQSSKYNETWWACAPCIEYKSYIVIDLEGLVFTHEECNDTSSNRT